VEFQGGPACCITAAHFTQTRGIRAG
jgi:hypothetical protein